MSCVINSNPIKRGLVEGGKQVVLVKGLVEDYVRPSLVARLLPSAPPPPTPTHFHVAGMFRFRLRL